MGRRLHCVLSKSCYLRIHSSLENFSLVLEETMHDAVPNATGGILLCLRRRVVG